MIDIGGNQKVSVVVDILRFSSTVTTLLTFVDEIYIALSEREKGIYIGEKFGVKREGYDYGNSPIEILKNKEEILERYERGEKIFIKTTNGTRVLESLKAEEIYIGSILNAEAVSKVSNSFSLIPCHTLKGFAIEDFIGCGVIAKFREDLDESALSAKLLAERDYREVIINSRSAQNLKDLGYENDIYFCLLENLYDIVGKYEKEKKRIVRCMI
ncbi:2-phosphosulfolactate phosphatase [Methanocaldococcus infernus ME]|uniref:2-phosphosulfolactate phosphatase n=1 Tax=Methanocaldococcus infernus (strain DSM 11812 / JCM 15783 / ME) TaxID=573063 RepID=D5VQN6_METIM|nr:2-phosphosulfolactate phosphatase [Methanocaldococcus infernus]ADG12889.1 2-phosphosulfolactate phosphatase [Methanocaldococcus infernus ME]